MAKKWKIAAVTLGMAILTIGSLVAAQPRGKAKGGASGGCGVTDIGSCPSFGCGKTEPDKLLNQRKRTVPPSGTAVSLSLDDFAALQQAADRLFALQHIPKAQLKELTAQERDLLRHLKVGSAHVSEGDFVQVSGYMIGLPQRPKAEGAESVNCNLKDDGTHKNNDFHIPLARKPSDTEYEGVVVEMIPQRRPPVWKIDTIRGLAQQQRPVLVRGQLLYDNKHLVNKDPTADNGQPKRFSLWEVHPVTEFYVCRKDSCDAANLDEWELQGKVQ